MLKGTSLVRAEHVAKPALVYEQYEPSEVTIRKLRQHDVHGCTEATTLLSQMVQQGQQVQVHPFDRWPARQYHFLHDCAEWSLTVGKGIS